MFTKVLTRFACVLFLAGALPVFAQPMFGGPAGRDDDPGNNGGKNSVGSLELQCSCTNGFQTCNKFQKPAGGPSTTITLAGSAKYSLNSCNVLDAEGSAYDALQKTVFAFVHSHKAKSKDEVEVALAYGATDKPSGYQRWTLRRVKNSNVYAGGPDFCPQVIGACCPRLSIEFERQCA